MDYQIRNELYSSWQADIAAREDLFDLFFYLPLSDPKRDQFKFFYGLACLACDLSGKAFADARDAYRASQDYQDYCNECDAFNDPTQEPYSWSPTDPGFEVQEQLYADACSGQLSFPF